ncbi:restriction endonuclease subunit S [Vagococcus lutrae]|uniref:restriction endonuclease subunit S n=1 Tax=Vagococcus lutrae TaxID=81947 RepID=UPI00200BBEC5|nr:restriction endonuclease subunit S [Vagococcus lutrae]MDT2826428.1 restriction endonuclease subunit S [Vagococcus lutrae]UQF24341.1 restriction endonuclease subunit S [Vagococcus lutrae]UQF63568.1 restriction endonuclease subunit S [Vagococcus lutrae]
MSREKKLVPKMRFKEFEDSQPWQNKDLGDMVNFYSGLTYSPSNIVEEPGTLVIRSSNVKNSEIVSADNVYVDSTIANSENVQIGDIIVVVRNGSKHLIGKNAQVKTPMENTVIGAFMTGIRSNTSKFINALLDTNKFQIEIYKDLGATINQITTGNLRKMKFNFPNEDEANKIGTYFEEIDNLIISRRKKINKIKVLKSAYLSEMFPKEGEKYPKKRFEGFTEPWNEYNLGEVAQIKTGNTNVQDAVPNGKFTFFDRSTEIKRIDKYYYDEEAIIYPGEGSEFYPRYFNGKYALHQRAYSITSDVVNLEYLSNMMLLRNNHFVNNAVGSTVKSLRMENFTKCKIFVPSNEEQKKITKLFKYINLQILVEEEKLAKLEKLKQAYLNDMFV